jgi:hypothetical protein
MSVSLVVDPGLKFAALDGRLTTLGFTRDATVRPVTPDIIAGEPELAAWTRGKAERLTYTFNPVVSLRVIQCSGSTDELAASLSGQLPLLDSNAIEKLLVASNPRRVLLGLMATRVLRAEELTPAVALHAAHEDAVICRAAAATLEALAFGTGATERQKALAVLQVLCQRAIPRLAALVGPDSARQLESMRPQAGDFARVFRPDIAGTVRAVFEEIWRAPPQMERLESGQMTLRVDAAPAGMLREDNELSTHFPGGYRALAPYLIPERIWFVWRYLPLGEKAGMRYDGVVMLDDRWVWFPRPHRVVGEILERRRQESQSL